MGMQTGREYAIMKQEKIVVTYLANSPLMNEMSKGPVKYIKHQHYGVRKQKERIKQYSNNKKFNQRF